MAGNNQQKHTAPTARHNQTVAELPKELPDGTLGLLFERSPDAIFLVEGDVLIDCNQAAIDMLGYPGKGELLAVTPADLSPQFQPDGRPSSVLAGEKIAAAIEHGSHRFEWTGKRADGREFPVEVVLTTIPAENRQLLLTIWRDISRRRSAELDRSAAEEALLNQTEILKSILNNMGDAVIVADQNYKFLIFNPAAEKMFGTGASETQAAGWSRSYGLYQPDEVTPFPPEELPMARAIRGEECRDVEVFVRHEQAPKGLWTRVSGRPLRNAKGELSGGVIVCRDITERKKEDAFRAGQGRVLEMIARGTALAEVLASLVQLIEAQSEGMTCSVLQLSEDGKYIRSGAAPGLPEIYVKAVDGAPIGPKNGSCGTAMYLGRQVIVTDMLDNPLWEDYRELAVLSGQRACWSTPIFSGTGKVLGSFAMYYRQPQTPSGTEARLTEVATHIAGIAIEHQRAEAELRASEERFAKAFDANPHPMSLASLDDGRIIEVNESFVKLSGYKRSELIGWASLEIVWEMPMTRGELIQQVRERGVVRDLEARIRTRRGAPRIVLLSSLMVEIGGQQCLLSVSNDITERRRAEEEVRLLQAITMDVAVAADLLAALEVVLQRVCETTGWMLGQAWLPRPDGTAIDCCPVWFSSGGGVEEFRLGSVNSSLPPGVGLPGRVLSSKRVAWLKDVTVDDNFPRAVLARECGLKAALALPILSGNEVIAVIEFFMREPRDEDERMVKVITSVAAQLDLALERKRAEEQLRRTQDELAHFARVTTMGELTASIAHEVNQPLGAIVGNAEICLQWLGDTQPDLAQLREAIEDIASDGRRASEVIARIRSLVKKNALDKTPLDLSAVAREVLDLVRHEAQRKKVGLRCELQMGLLVEGDRVQLQQVLLNLLMNGIEAMTGLEDRRPEITVRIWRADSGDVLTTVRDNGPGIRPGDADQLFKPFHTTKAAGMGMGLAISRSIIEAHGGWLRIEQSQGPGAMFQISLPPCGNGGS